MALSRWRVNFTGNQRVDLPDFRQMMARAFADFDLLIRSYLDNEAVPRMLRRYQEGTHAANVFQIRRDLSRAFHNSIQNWLYINPDTTGTIDLALQSGTDNYVMVRIREINDDLQARAFWDTDINITGEEFFDEVNVRTRLEEEFLVTQTGFEDPADGWMPLFVVTVGTDGSVIDTVRADNLLWQPRDLALPQDRESLFDSTVTDMRSFIDLLGSVIGEVKGTASSLESIPWSSIKLLKEYQSLFVTGAGNISFGVAGPDTLRFTDLLKINIPGRDQTYTVGQALTNNDYQINDEEVAFVRIPEGASANLALETAPIGQVPINPTRAGFTNNILVLFYRKGLKIYGSMELPDLDSGETGTVGQDLPVLIRQRLGITSDTAFKAYTSLVNLLPNDSYPDAISKLDAAIAAIQNSLPQEEVFTVDVGGETTFNLTSISFLNNHTIADIQVTVNGIKQQQDLNGGSDAPYKKVGTNQIVFNSVIKEKSVVCVRKERTGGGGGGSGAGAGDLTNIFVDPQPDLDGGHSLGTNSKAWSALTLKDGLTGINYVISLQGGTLTIEEV